MLNKKLSNHIRDNNIYRILDKIVLITFPLIYIIFIFIADKFVVNMEINGYFLFSRTMMLALILIVLQARALGRNVKSIEVLIIKEVQPILSKKNKGVKTWEMHKGRFRLIQIITSIILFGSLAILIRYPDFFYNNYVREIHVLLVIIYILSFGLVRLILFRNYINELIQLYIFLVRSLGKEFDVQYFMKYDFRRILMHTIMLGAVFFIVIRYLVLTDLKLINIMIFEVSFCVLVMLGRALYDANKEFYRSLAQIDELRNMIDQ